MCKYKDNIGIAFQGKKGLFLTLLIINTNIS